MVSIEYFFNLPFLFPDNRNSSNSQRQNSRSGVTTSSEETPRSTRTPSTNHRSRPLPPMRISRRLRRVDVSNDTQFENMRRRLLLEDLEADVKAKRATEQAMKSQMATQEQIR